MGPHFDDRLRAELDRFEGTTPLPETARFSRVQARRRLVLLKPALALAGALGILMVAASPLQGLAYELHSGVYIAGEIIGAVLLLWDLARKRTLKH